MTRHEVERALVLMASEVPISTQFLHRFHDPAGRNQIAMLAQLLVENYPGQHPSELGLAPLTQARAMTMIGNLTGTGRLPESYQNFL